ncbi:hypothetical protein NQ315_012843 [Exocentrus adspersus]|uniref:Tyr recombinase domain-containing protein n=1 Tax=Exocentrus adspersus TaxID=1586481 RepID=A0AAV8VDC4_9CUCU|nr:hypothetical protein NQ315_012843 [Exocentrus adspersus]
MAFKEPSRNIFSFRLDYLYRCASKDFFIKYVDLKPEHNFLFGMRKVNVLFKPLEKNFGKIHKKWQNLNLPNSTLYTGHCFRRTSASLLADSGASYLERSISFRIHRES